MAQEEAHIEALLQPDEMKFVDIPNMPIYDCGGTFTDCEIYGESSKRGYIVQSILPLFGTDGSDVWVGIVYAKYPHQTEYQTLSIILEDQPEFAGAVGSHKEAIQTALQSVVSSFDLKQYFQKFDIVSIAEVKLLLFVCVCVRV